MTTIERPIETSTGPPAVPKRRRPWLAGLIAVLALIVGMGIGWFARGGDDDPDAVLAGGGTMTDRQEQMVDMSERYNEAWIASDYEAMVAMMTPDAVMRVGEDVNRLDDGTLQAMVEGLTYTSLTPLTPMLVYENSTVGVFTYQGSPALSVVDFTEDGELLITQHVLYDIF